MFTSKHTNHEFHRTYGRNESHETHESDENRGKNGTHGTNEENGSLCKNGASGLFPHSSDCKKFVDCDRGRAYVMECGPGTVFNPESSVCDWPEHVTCLAQGN